MKKIKISERERQILERAVDTLYTLSTRTSGMALQKLERLANSIDNFLNEVEDDD